MADDALAGWSTVPNREELQTEVTNAATSAGLDPAFVSRLVQQESSWDPARVSKRGAVGLMQVLPSTAADYGVTNPTDAHENIKAGISHLKRLNEKYKGDLTLVAAAYNAGEGAVHAHGNTVPPFKETKDYVQKVAQPELDGWAVAADPNKPPTPKPASPAEQKKQDRVTAYAKANPTLWSRITGAVEQSFPGTSDLVTGIGQGVVKGVTHLGQAVQAIPGFKEGMERYTGISPEQQTASMNAVQKMNEGQNFNQKAGQFIERAAEFALPAGKVTEGANVLSTGARIVPKVLTHVAGGATLGAADAKLHGESPIVGAITGGIGGALSPVIEGASTLLGKRAVTSVSKAVNPTEGLVRQAPTTWGRTPVEKLQGLSKYILENDLTPEKAAAAAQTMRDALESAKTSPGGQTVVPDIVKQVEDALTKLRKTQPNAQVSADIQAQLDRLMTTTPGAPVPAPSQQGTLFNPQGQKIPTMVPGKPVVTPRADVTAGEIQSIAQDARNAVDKSFGSPLSTSTKQADRAATRALRTAAGNTSSEIRSATSGMPEAITAEKAMEKYALRLEKGGKLDPGDEKTWTIAFGLAVPSLGTSFIPKVISGINKMDPLRAGKIMYSLSNALKTKNVGLVRQIIAATTQAGAGELTQ